MSNVARFPRSWFLVALDMRQAGRWLVDLAGLLAELAATRRRGFVLTGSVLTAGATMIAAAVNDPASGGPIALALAYLDSAVSPPLQERMAHALLARTRQLECPSGEATAL
jgi:DNA-binding IclR family transcriptional regulator